MSDREKQIEKLYKKYAPKGKFNIPADDVDLTDEQLLELETVHAEYSDATMKVLEQMAILDEAEQRLIGKRNGLKFRLVAEYEKRASIANA